MSWPFITLLGIVAAAGLAGAPARADSPEVLTFAMSMSNIHAIRGARTVLVDAGGKGDLPKLEAALARSGTAWRDIAAVIVTHAHADHAALAAEIRRRSGATVMLGRGDRFMAEAGHNDDLRPTSLTGTLLKRFAIDPSYEAFEPDRTIDRVTRLETWGVASQIVPMPGHTPGSLVVELDDGRSLVGDMILGGYLGGSLLRSRPGEHYFHADRHRNLENIRTLLRGSARVFSLGHGGPVSREAVARVFADRANKESASSR